MNRSFLKSVLAFFICIAVVPIHADVCTHNTPANNIIKLNALTTGEATYPLTNPMKGQTATNIKAEWFTDQQLLSGFKAAAEDVKAVSVDTKRLPFSLGLCRPDPSDNTKPQVLHVNGTDLSALADAEAIIIYFVPNEIGSVSQVLRLTWDVPDPAAAGKTKQATPQNFEVVGNAGAPDFATDSRHKVWLYTGYTYLRTKNDFKDQYPELLIRLETRLYDSAISTEETDPARFDRMRRHMCVEADKCTSIPRFAVMRLYGETGLTGTAVVTADTTPGVPNGTTVVAAVKQAFTGSFGIGGGWTLPVTTRDDGDTNAFTVLGVGRLGIITVPGIEADATKNIAQKPGSTAFNWSIGTRFENANLSNVKGKGGNFEGAYFEFGMGESEQFARKKLPRFRVDGLMPLPAGSDLVRFALRLQLDTTRPFHPKENVDSGGEIRISGLFNIDLKELMRRFGGGK